MENPGPSHFQEENDGVGESEEPLVHKECKEKGKSRRTNTTRNDFEDPQEMARVIAKSKGQPIEEFVARISRHTSDRGNYLRFALRTETTIFGKRLDHIFSQRIKDANRHLTSEQACEKEKINDDINKWWSEMANCKRRIREIIPNFCIEAYERDKDYLIKVFAVEVCLDKPDDDDELKDEDVEKLHWLQREISKLNTENEQMRCEVEVIQSQKCSLLEEELSKERAHEKDLECLRFEVQKLKLNLAKLQEERMKLCGKLRELKAQQEGKPQTTSEEENSSNQDE